MEQMVNNGIDRLFSHCYVNPGKETILLLHGGPGCPDNMESLASRLAAHFQVITFHQRGTGRSPCPSKSFTMTKYISDIDVVAAHFGVSQFHLFGHSWGGLYAGIYAQEHPEALLSLFLCNPALGTGADWKLTEKEVLKYNRSACSGAEWMGMGYNSLLGALGSDRAYQRLYRQVWKNYNKGFAGDTAISFDLENIRASPINRTRRHIARYPPLRDIARPPFPLTIVFGDHDIYGGHIGRVINRYRLAAVQVIDNCGHFPWLHNQAMFRQVLFQHYNIAGA